MKPSPSSLLRAFAVQLLLCWAAWGQSPWQYGMAKSSVVTAAWNAYVNGLITSYAQPLNANLTTIAGLTPTTDNIIQAKGGAWFSRTIAQLKTDLSLSGVNTGDQTVVLSGDATGSGQTNITVVFANTAVTPGTYTVATITVDSKGRITGASSGTIPVSSLTGAGTGVLAALAQALNSASGLPSATSPTFFGNATLGNGTGNPVFYINGATNGVKGWDIYANGSIRVRLATTGTEGGTTDGNSLLLQMYNNSGGGVVYPQQWNRDGSVSIRAPASGSAATYFPVYITDPTTGAPVQIWSRTPSQVKSDLSMGNVENTALSTWAGSPSITTLGTISSGSVPLARITGLGTGIAAALAATPTGSGVVVLATNAALTTPAITGGTTTNTTISQSTYTQKVAVWSSNGILSGGNASNVELNQLVGVTSAIQTQLDGKEPTITTLAAGKLPTSGVTAGSYGNDRYSATISVDQYGRITAISTNAISGGSTTTSFVVLDGSVGYTTITSGNGFTNGGTIINMTTHGLNSGDVVWFQNSTKGPFIDTAYYVTKVDNDNYKISTSQANRLAGTFVPATADGVCYARRWNSNPVLASSNVDGVIRPWSKTAGTYIVDFTTNPSDAYYAVTGSAKTVTDGTPLLFTVESRAATTSAFAVQVTDTADNLTDSDRVSITATR